MRLPASADLAASLGGELRLFDETPSTNSDAMAAAASGSSAFTVVATGSQTRGRGRLGREWAAPAGESLAVSVVLRPVGVPLARYGWLPLIGGLALVHAVSALLPGRQVALKWPNDVLVGSGDGADRGGIAGRKVAGLLAELAPGATAVVLGAGLNLAIPADRMPVPTATSLLVEGATPRGDDLADAALTGWLRDLHALLSRFEGAAGDAEAAGVRPLVEGACGTLGRDVEVQLPGGGAFTGRALALDADGRLVVRRDDDGAHRAVAAGDVLHLR